MSDDCIFCKIVRKEAPASVVYEDNQVMAFMDIRPVNQGHTLIIPKKHYVDIFDITEGLLGDTHKVAKKIATAIMRATKADGFSIVQQNGAAAGQDIFHIHVHIIPMFEGQKTPHLNELSRVSREILDQTAEKIRKQI